LDSQFNLVTNYHRKPFYVGKGVGRRADAHFRPSQLKSKSHKNHTIKKAWSEGKRVFIEYLHTGLSDAEACSIEKDYIESLGRSWIKTGILTNVSEGGQKTCGWKHSEETKRRIGNAGLGRKHSERARALIAQAAREQIRGPVSESTKEKLKRARATQIRKPMSEDQKHKLREANLGKTLSRKTRKKISIAQKGHTVSESTRQKISEANTGRPRGPMSEEHRKSISEALSGKPKSAEHSAKQAAARVGQKRTPEQKERMRLAALNKAPMSEAHRKALSEAQKARRAKERSTT
jgi:hypothetical protein